jgi:hypothetical protein
MQHRFPEIIDSFLNGNIKDFKNTIGYLSKKDLLSLIEYWPEHTTHTTEEVIAIIKKHL